MGQIERTNTIIVGAGASCEFGLPSGDGLKNIISTISDIRFNRGGAELISGDYDFEEALRLLASERFGSQDINRYLYAGWKIRDNMKLAPSINNFLRTHQNSLELVEFGKLATVNAISAAERTSSLNVDPRGRESTVNFGNVGENWLTKLFQILVAGRTFEDFIASLSEISFVSLITTGAFTSFSPMRPVVTLTFQTIK